MLFQWSLRILALAIAACALVPSGARSASLRCFAEHEVRQCRSLDGYWDFALAGESPLRDGLPVRYPRRIAVPSAWEKIPGLENYRGTAWLRTTIQNAPRGKAVRLVFGGVSHTGTVYLDGTKRGGHYDAFTPWDVIVPSSGAGESELVVEVDNSFGEHSALHIDNDYYTYGGITRPVVLEYVPGLYIDRIFAEPRGSVAEGWSLEVRVRLANWTGNSLAGTVRVEVAGKTAELGGVSVEGGGTAVAWTTLENLDVEPWSADSPGLYRLKATLSGSDGRVSDDLIDRVGFRTVRVEGKRVLVNGTPVRFRGVNRHEDHPDFGNAIPLEAMREDLEIIRDLGCNFIRTSHYPNDMRFLDLCDELGLYVWEESHARNVDFEHPKFREQIAASTREMVDWHFNRPCIVMWGCLNECASDTEEGRREYELVTGLIREHDTSRPITFATNRLMRDICLDLADIVSWNIYTGWYGSTVDQLASRLDEVLAWQDTASLGTGKPVIISEFGAGAIYGVRSPTRAKWTEEYQRYFHDEALRVYLNHPRLSGAVIWQYCDVRVSDGWWYGRPRTYNNKGIVDEHRRPKLSYDRVRARMLEAAAREKAGPE